MSDSVVTRSKSEIRQWLVSAIRARQVRSVEIDTSLPFYSYGVDSVERMSIASELEVWLGFAIGDDALREHDTIDKLAAHLAGE